MESPQNTPERSPEKTYIPLEVTSPTQIQRPGIHSTDTSPAALVICNSGDETKELPTCDTISPLQGTSSTMAGHTPIKITHTEPSNESDLRATQEELLLPRFTSFLTREFGSENRTLEAQVTNLAHSFLPTEEDGTTRNQSPVEHNAPAKQGGSQHVTATKPEIFAHTNVVNRISRSLLPGGDGAGEHFSLNVVSDPPISPHRPDPGSSRDTVTTSTAEEARLCSSGEDVLIPADKRQWPKYSLKTSMLRKHPVTQFSATGPIDRAKSPYKWWCRVCRVEFSLMSRGVLELLSHYKTEGDH